MPIEPIAMIAISRDPRSAPRHKLKAIGAAITWGENPNTNPANQ
jgi:hypothetical protein